MHDDSRWLVDNCEVVIFESDFEWHFGSVFRGRVWSLQFHPLTRGDLMGLNGRRTPDVHETRAHASLHFASAESGYRCKPPVQALAVVICLNFEGRNNSALLFSSGKQGTRE